MCVNTKHEIVTSGTLTSSKSNSTSGSYYLLVAKAKQLVDKVDRCGEKVALWLRVHVGLKSKMNEQAVSSNLYSSLMQDLTKNLQSYNQLF